MWTLTLSMVIGKQYYTQEPIISFTRVKFYTPDPQLYGAFVYGPRQANLVLIAYASSEGSGETARMRRLA